MIDSMLGKNKQDCCQLNIKYMSHSADTEQDGLEQELSLQIAHLSMIYSSLASEIKIWPQTLVNRTEYVGT